MKLVGGFNIRHFLKHIHEFRKIKKLRKSGSGTIASSFRSQLNGGGSFAKGRRPGVKIEQAVFFQGVVLQILLHGIHLHHGVGDGGACGEHNAPAPGQLVQIAAFHIEVAGLLGLRLADAAHIPHFGKGGEVFVIVGFIDKEAVNAQFFKCDHIILTALVVQLC